MISADLQLPMCLRESQIVRTPAPEHHFLCNIIILYAFKILHGFTSRPTALPSFHLLDKPKAFSFTGYFTNVVEAGWELHGILKHLIHRHYSTSNAIRIRLMPFALTEAGYDGQASGPADARPVRPDSTNIAGPHRSSQFYPKPYLLRNRTP